MTDTYEALLEDSIEIDAPPATVWPFVADLKKMADRSPQVVRSWVRGGEVREGATFVNLNRQGPLFWPTQAKVVSYDVAERFAFRVKENRVIWSFTLEPTATGGTRLTERRETPQGISNVSLRLTKAILGGQESFTARLRDGMRQTLASIKADAER